MSKSSDDATEHLPRPIAQALEKQNRKLERIESKIDRILDLVQKIDTRMEDAIEEYEEFDEFDDDEPPPTEEIVKELEKLSPEEFKQRFVELLASLEAARAAEDEDDEDEER